MSIETITKTIVGDTPGTTTQLTYFKIGPADATKKVYLQAALHADEQPGILILHHLLALLRKADAAGQLQALFVVMPMVNPIGMADIEFGQHQGRYDRNSGVNHNRQWPDLFSYLAPSLHSLEAKLGVDAEHNKCVIREAVGEWLATYPRVKARDQWRHMVLSEAYDADYVFDLHCDDDSLIHIFSLPQMRESMQQLANHVGAAATLMAEDSGGGSFDEVWPAVWLKLAEAYPDKNIPMPITSCTLEYRGRFDTFDAINSFDAERLYSYFQSTGLIAGTVLQQPQSMPVATDLDATEIVRTEQAGLLAYCVEIGDYVECGDKIADLIQLDGEQAFVARQAIVAGTSGLVLSRVSSKYVWRGASVAKIVGAHKLATRGTLLLED